jgi:hypothetical protein
VTGGAPSAGPAAPAGGARALVGIVRSSWAAGRGGAAGFVGLIAVGQVLALILHLAVGVYGTWSWSKIGLLTSLLALGTEIEATVQGIPGVSQRSLLTEAGPLRWQLVPMLLTIGFLWVVAGAARRAAQAYPGRSPLAASALAAIGAGVPVGALAALAATVARLSFPRFALRLEADPGSAALWGFAIAASASAVGAYLRAARDSHPAGALRAGLLAYVSALGLCAVAVVVIAALEPDATGAYVRALHGLGAGGAAVFAGHLLLLPAQSALLLVPASGACLDLEHLGRAFARMCPWSIESGGAALPVTDLSPWFWLLSAVPLLGAFMAGRWAGRGWGRRAAGARGAAAGAVFAALLVAGAWFAAPELLLPLIPLVVQDFTVRPDTLPFAVAALVWGVGGGLLGGLASRRS